MDTIVTYSIILVFIGIASFLVCKFTTPCKEEPIANRKINESINVQNAITITNTLYNPIIGAHKKTYNGFSWTVLLFGFFVPLFREDYKWAVIMFLSAIVTAGLSNIFFAIKYNELQIKDLKEKGYRESE